MSEIPVKVIYNDKVIAEDVAYGLGEIFTFNPKLSLTVSLSRVADGTLVVDIESVEFGNE